MAEPSDLRFLDGLPTIFSKTASGSDPFAGLDCGISFRRAEPLGILPRFGRLISEGLEIRESEEDRGFTPGRGGKEGVEPE